MKYVLIYSLMFLVVVNMVFAYEGFSKAEEGEFFHDAIIAESYENYSYDIVDLSTSRSSNPYNYGDPPGKPIKHTLYHPLVGMRALNGFVYDDRANINRAYFEVKLEYSVHYPTNEILRERALAYDDIGGNRDDMRLGHIENDSEEICSGNNCFTGLEFKPSLEGAPPDSSPHYVKYEGSILELERVGFEDDGEFPEAFESEPQINNSFNSFKSDTIDDLAPEVDYQSNVFVHTRFHCPESTGIGSYVNTHSDGVSVDCWVDHDVRRDNIEGGEHPVAFNYEDTGEVVDWDGDQQHCEAFGGDWLDGGTEGLETSADYFSHERGDYRCCGDDWIWIYNLVSGYDSGIQQTDATSRIEGGDPVCLYDPVSLSLQEVLGFKAEGFDEDTGNYRCPGTDHEAYDPALTLADDYREDTESIFGHHEDLFYLSGSADNTSVRTDQGKWTPWDGDNWLEEDAMFCYHDFDQGDEYGESFEWLSIEEASDKNQMVCDIYLGYNWTGNKCCFEGRNDMDVVTYNDTGLACNSTYALDYTLDRVSYAFSSPQFKHEFFDECDRIIDQNAYNPACFEGQPVQNDTATYSEPGIKDVFNEGGVLHFCEREDGNTDYEDMGFDHVEKCGLRGTESYPHVCTYNNDSWFNSDVDSGYLGRFEEHLEDFSREELENNISTSSLPFDDVNMPNNLEDKQQQECCFFGSCWNGTQCVGIGRYHETGSHGMYMVIDDEWVSYDISHIDTTDPDSNEIDTYMCQNGEWIESDPMFNWFYDLSRPGFCPNEYQCFYKDADESQHDIAYDLAEFDDDQLDQQGAFSCTLDENAYTQDHYCEAIYDNGEVVDSRWTSRTKLVALQLGQIAEDEGSSDYTLFCGHKNDSVNDPSELGSNRLPDDFDVNNVCVLQYGEYNNKTAMGFSFNSPGDSDEPMRDFLFGTQGFVNRVGHSEIGECETEIDSNGDQHGAYTKCIDNELWVNLETESVIYSKDGIGVGNGQLPEADMGIFDDAIDEMLTGVSAIVDEEDNLPDSEHLLLKPSDFRNFYINSTGSGKIIGFMEERWDTSLGHQERPVPHYIAVKYPSENNVCEKVEFSKQKYGYPIYCYEHNGDEYVVGNHYPSKDLSEPLSPDFWKGLAPRLRVI